MDKNRDIESYYMAQNRIYELQLEKCFKTNFLELFKILLEAEGTIWLIGNGGSLAVAKHAALDLTKAAKKRAFAIGNSDIITAYSNDISFAEGIASYLDQIWMTGWIYPAPILIALSTSGESPNIISAIKIAKKYKIFSCALTSKGSTLAKETNLALEFDEKDPKVLEDIFQITFHKLTRMLENLK